LRSKTGSSTVLHMQVQRPLSYRHRVITDADLVFIRGLIAENPQCSRRALSLKLCQAWNWVQANGVPRDMVCRGMMLMLHRQGLIELPPVRVVARVLRQGLSGRKKPAAVSVDQTALSVSLVELGPLEVRQVRRTHEARLANIRLLAYNTRFLILPWIHVPHLASHILGRMVRMLSADWQSMYAHPIHFVETFIDPQRFRGTCYLAANWTLMGVTTGRGKDAPTYEPNRSIKQVLGYPLVKDLRQRLSRLSETVDPATAA
jgi:hypothetical protein